MVEMLNKSAWRRVISQLRGYLNFFVFGDQEEEEVKISEYLFDAEIFSRLHEKIEARNRGQDEDKIGMASSTDSSNLSDM